MLSSLKVATKEDYQPAYELAGSRLAKINPMTQHEFLLFKELLFRQVGINFSMAKKSRIEARLVNRVGHHGLTTFFEYYQLVLSGTIPSEMQVIIDLLTTNETFFFRESAHFDFFSEEILPQYRFKPIRVWSAACSSGEETYSLGMILDDKHEGKNWELIGSDISQKVLQKASVGHYPMLRHEGIPESYLKKYCLRGTGGQKGTLLINRKLRDRIKFCRVNLNAQLVTMGKYNVIFLRNVLIYFNQEKKADVVRRIVAQLEPGGYLFISHTENLQGIDDELEMIRPSIFRKID